MEILGDRLKNKRVEKKISQAKVSELLHISVVTYGEWERGNHEPRIEDLIKLANIYETSIDYLVGRY